MIAQLDPLYLRTSRSKSLVRLVSYALFEGRPVTTSGRWINPLVFSLLSLARRFPAPRQVDSPIFIVGAGRSGTTILGKILSLHPQIGYLNEPKAIWHAAHGGEDLIGSYSSGKARYRLPVADATPEVGRAMRRMYGWYLAFTRSRRVLDKYPELVFRISFLRALFPAAKFLFIVRNGWDTCKSIEGWSATKGARNGATVHDWWGVDNRKWRLMVDELVPTDDSLARHREVISGYQNQTDRAAVEWILTMKEGMQASEEHADVVIRIKYEDLVGSPAQTLSEIFRFCGMPDDQRVVGYARSVLRSSRVTEPLGVHSAILPEFNVVMQGLGYL